jgi:hypothetical protein
VPRIEAQVRCSARVLAPRTPGQRRRHPVPARHPQLHRHRPQARPQRHGRPARPHARQALATARAGILPVTGNRNPRSRSPRVHGLIVYDRSAVQRLAVTHWIPILSSKKVGTVDPRDAEFPNQAYTNEMMLQNFNYWRSRYSSALLLRSSSYSSLATGYWVPVLNQACSAPGDVISWCKAQGLNDDDCDATLLSNHLPDGPQTYRGW